MNLGTHLRLGTVGSEVPSLALDFVSAPILSSAVTFSRGSAATTVGQDGLIQTVAVDAPRFDFDPVTLAPRGLLIEEARTNLFVNSLVNGVSLATQNVSVTAVPHTISFYGTGTITLSGAAVSAVVGTGAYPNRQTLTFTPTLGVLVCTVVGLVQYAQLEVGSFATSFIPTGASPTARAADVAAMTGTNFSSWYNQSEGTFVSTWSTIGRTATDMILSATDGTSANAVQQFFITPTVTRFSVRVTSVDQTTIDAPFNSSVVNRLASAYKANDFATTANGGTVATDAAGTIPVVDRLNIGSRLGTLLFNGRIRQINYYNRRLPNLTLQRLSA